MTAPAPDFDAAREAYEAARLERDRIIDHPDKSVSVLEYTETLWWAKYRVSKAHEKMMEAWG